jgi:hypothetical protein
MDSSEAGDPRTAKGTGRRATVGDEKGGLARSFTGGLLECKSVNKLQKPSFTAFHGSLQIQINELFALASILR